MRQIRQQSVVQNRGLKFIETAVVKLPLSHRSLGCCWIRSDRSIVLPSCRPRSRCGFTPTASRTSPQAGSIDFRKHPHQPEHRSSAGNVLPQSTSRLRRLSHIRRLRPRESWTCPILIGNFAALSTLRSEGADGVGSPRLEHVAEVMTPGKIMPTAGDRTQMKSLDARVSSRPSP